MVTRRHCGLSPFVQGLTQGSNSVVDVRLTRSGARLAAVDREFRLQMGVSKIRALDVDRPGIC